MTDHDPIRILIIEDNNTMREGIAEVLKSEGFSVCAESNGQSGIDAFGEEPFDIVITDYKMSPVDGLSVLKRVKELFPETEVIMITAFGSVEIAVEAMKNGASDFITKPFSPDELVIKIRKIIQVCQERRQFQRTSEENQYLREEIEDRFNFGEIIGRSSRMNDVYDMVRKSADADSSVLIYGESGTGKELIARAIHVNSHRSDKPFIKVNCAALTETLLESELFGHEKGSFTGAIKTKKGRFELADTGTIFLDEIGDISLNLQVKLLRVLQEKEFERVGGEVTLSVDTRVIAATNRNLQQAIKNGTFREDLYYRLHIIPILLPPLRERKDDIPPLVEFFVKRFEKELGKSNMSVSDEAMDVLLRYDWPGNVRELENVIERSVVLSNSSELTAGDFSMLDNLTRSFFMPLEDIEKTGLDSALERIEKTLIQQALQKAQGNKSEAARILGVKTSAFFYKLEKYGLL